MSDKDCDPDDVEYDEDDDFPKSAHVYRGKQLVESVWIHPDYDNLVDGEPQRFAVHSKSRGLMASVTSLDLAFCIGNAYIDFVMDNTPGDETDEKAALGDESGPYVPYATDRDGPATESFRRN